MRNETKNEKIKETGRRASLINEKLKNIKQLTIRQPLKQYCFELVIQ